MSNEEDPIDLTDTDLTIEYPVTTDNLRTPDISISGTLTGSQIQSSFENKNLSIYNSETGQYFIGDLPTSKILPPVEYIYDPNTGYFTADLDNHPTLDVNANVDKTE